jgi:two-component system, OmpR family, phosphate regulon sensor histidine kinase PhoR
VTFASRLLFATVLVVVVTLGALLLAADRGLRRSLDQSLADDLEREARLVASLLPRHPEELQAAAHRLGGILGRRITVIDSTGTVLGDTDFDDASLALLENHLSRPEVEEALRTGVGVDTRAGAPDGRTELEVAVRAWPGVVRISSPASQVNAIVGDAQRAVLVAALAALLLGMALATFVGRTITTPLSELGTAARALAAGNPPHYPAGGAPEIQQLVRAFRAMETELAERIAALQRGREETATLIESMVEGVVATDASGNVAVCNGALRRWFDFGAEEPIPNLRELFHNADARDVVDQVLAGRAILGREITFDDRAVLVTARPLPTGGAVVCLHDITNVKRLEAIRRDFVANVSHELKTPLTSIAGYAETLLTDTPDDATRQRFLDVIAQNARRMQHLVDDLLDLARLDSGGWRPVIQVLDVAESARAAWATLAEGAGTRNVTLEAADADGKRIHADPDALTQVFTNLFDNALRHTPPGGRIVVEARRVEGGVQVIIRDTGAGIPAEHLPRVFERFYRVDPARSRDQGGTGLGLSIVRHLVEAHGGRVDLESALGVGTTVRLTFPISTAAV